MRTSTVVWTIVVLVVIAGIGWYVLALPQNGATQTATVLPPDSNSTTTSQTITTTNTASSTTTNSAPMQATVQFTDQGWSPSSVTIAKGGTVTFVNKSASQMWVASDPHPTHQGYDGTTRAEHCAQGYSGPAPFDECSSGTTFSFTFDKTGSFGFHNHDADADKGTIVVQ